MVSPTTPLLTTSLQLTFLKVQSKQRFPKSENFASAAWHQVSLQHLPCLKFCIMLVTPHFDQGKVAGLRPKYKHPLQE